MNRSVKMIFAGLLVLAVVLAAQPVSAQIETTCKYNPTNDRIEYTLTGDMGGATYEAKFEDITGCVDTVSTTGTWIGNGGGSADLECLTADSKGSFRVDICEQGSICFASYYFKFGCDVTCQIYEVDKVPTLQTWGLVALLLVMAIAAVVIARRRRVTA